jgi:SNF2 family DNA or RNA helicase
MQLRKICNHPFLYKEVEDSYAMHVYGQAKPIVDGQ